MGKTEQDSTSRSPHSINTTATTPMVKRARKRVSRHNSTAPVQRSSIYRGVTRHRWTGRFEAHLWDKSCWNDSQKKKGKQVYLGAYEDEAAAGRAYDLAALKYWGRETVLNFPLSNYENEIKEMEVQSREEYIGSIRRQSSGFSRGVSKYRGVARHHQNGRWEARIGRVFGNKYLYLGTYATEEEAAMAYDMAAIEHRGISAITNFDVSRYVDWNQGTEDSDQDSKASSQVSSQMAMNEGNVMNSIPLLSDQRYDSQSSVDKATSIRTGSLQSQTLSPAAHRLSEWRSFPDDVQTYFHNETCEDYNYADDIIFSELEAITSIGFELELSS